MSRKCLVCRNDRGLRLTEEDEKIAWRCYTTICDYIELPTTHEIEQFKSGQQTAMTSNQARPIAQTEKLAPGVEQIPYESIEAIGEIFTEGEIKYGRDNWKKAVGDTEYQTERTRHAIRHLQLWANGDRSENHLAKVAWFCVTQIWLMKQE